MVQCKMWKDFEEKGWNMELTEKQKQKRTQTNHKWILEEEKKFEKVVVEKCKEESKLFDWNINGEIRQRKFRLSERSYWC